MSPSFALGIAFTVVLAIVLEVKSGPAITVKNVDIGEHCALGAAPVGPNGSWQIVEKNVQKICAPGSSCRKGACNCDNLGDGTVMGMSMSMDNDKRVCRRIAGQKCSRSADCFQGVDCVKGVCTCDKTKKNDFNCVDYKNDVTILA